MTTVSLTSGRPSRDTPAARHNRLINWLHAQGGIEGAWDDIVGRLRQIEPAASEAECCRVVIDFYELVVEKLDLCIAGSDVAPDSLSALKMARAALLQHRELIAGIWWRSTPADPHRTRLFPSMMERFGLDHAGIGRVLRNPEILP